MSLKPALTLNPTKRSSHSYRRKSVTFKDEEKGEALVEVRVYRSERSNKDMCCVLS